MGSREAVLPRRSWRVQAVCSEFGFFRGKMEEARNARIFECSRRGRLHDGWSGDIGNRSAHVHAGQHVGNSGSRGIERHAYPLPAVLPLPSPLLGPTWPLALRPSVPSLLITALGAGGAAFPPS